MTLNSLLVAIGKMAISDRMIGFAGAGNSIYELNDLDIRNYPILYVSPTGSHRVEENYTTYAITLFYIDRLVEDNSNSVNIHSTSIEVLKNLIRKIRKMSGVVDVSDSYIIQLFTETERMKDRCNGAYAQLEISVVNDTICDVYSADEPESGDTPTGETYFIITVPLNQEIPDYATSIEITWDTNKEGPFPYVFTSPSGTEIGYATGSGQTITFPANTGDEPIVMTFEIEDNVIRWTQKASEQPVEYFDFDNEDGAVLDSGTTAYTITWETELTSVTYTVEDANGNIIASGTTSDSGVTVTFPENTGSTIAQYTIIVTNGNGKVMGQLDWYVLGDVERDWRPDSGGTHGYADEYLTLDIISGGTVSFTGGIDWDGTKAYYSKDSGNTWVEITSTREPTPLFEVEAGERVHFYSDVYIDYHRIRTDAIYNVEGNIDSLVNGGRVVFENTNVVSAEHLVLPSVLHKNHLAFMFHKCRMLVVPPQLPATIMAPKCYMGMFSWCDNLENAPALPATTLAESCYDAMFMNCPSLIQAPDLNATTLVDGCYDSMFFKCGALNYVKCLAENHSGGGSETHKWLYNVAENGTFVKSASAAWRRGVSGIPENWEVTEI